MKTSFFKNFKQFQFFAVLIALCFEMTLSYDIQPIETTTNVIDYQQLLSGQFGYSESQSYVHHPRLKAGQLYVMDYILAALEGLKSDYYVPGSFACGNNTKYFQIDAMRTVTNFQTTSTSTLDGVEDVTFNTTATLSGYLPDAIYYCYFVPGDTYDMWTEHYKTFEDIHDFEGAFIQNIMGNFLTFIDIYNQTTIAAQDGDFLTVIYEMARLVRRLLDFKSMERGTLIAGLTKLQQYLYVMSLSEITVQADTPFEIAEDIATFSISAFTGFIDGSFKAGNTSYCRKSLLRESYSVSNLTTAIQDDDENHTVYFSTRMLKYMHPSLYHCYYAGKETYVALNGYIDGTSWKDLLYNLVYQTGPMCDQIRIIYTLVMKDTYLDKEVYVIARSLGTILNLIISPYNQRVVY